MLGQESGVANTLADVRPRTNGKYYPPAAVHLREPQRGRLVLDFEEMGVNEHAAEEGWLQIAGPWVHFLGDETEHWQSWPMANVVCIDWFQNGQARA